MFYSLARTYFLKYRYVKNCVLREKGKGCKLMWYVCAEINPISNVLATLMIPLHLLRLYMGHQVRNPDYLQRKKHLIRNLFWCSMDESFVRCSGGKQTIQYILIYVQIKNVDTKYARSHLWSVGDITMVTSLPQWGIELLYSLYIFCIVFHGYK